MTSFYVALSLWLGARTLDNVNALLPSLEERGNWKILSRLPGKRSSQPMAAVRG